MSGGLGPHGACDVAIVGAGPAGATLAGLLAMRGVDVVLLEKDRFPRDKLCGEFLSHEARPLLGRLGVEEELGAKAASITKARVFSKRGETLETSLPGEAFGISRLTLDESLWRRVQRLGVRAFEKADVREVVASGHTTTLTIKHAGAMSVLTPKVTVGAWGRRTRLDRQLERPFLQARHPWVGMKQHHRPVSAQAGDEVARMLGGQVELHAFEGGYCGLNYVDGGVINACALLTQEAFDRLGAGPDWRALALMMNRSSRSLWSRMHLLEPTETGTQAVAQVPFEQKNVYADGVFWLGDAAGMITPMTGDGQAMAIQSAGLLEPLIWDLLTALENESAAGAGLCPDGPSMGASVACPLRHSPSPGPRAPSDACSPTACGRGDPGWGEHSGAARDAGEGDEGVESKAGGGQNDAVRHFPSTLTAHPGASSNVSPERCPS